MGGLAYLDPVTASTKTVTVQETRSAKTTTVIAASTIYITAGETSSECITAAISSTTSSTSTAYVPSKAIAKRSGSTCDTVAALSSLSDLGSFPLSTACSCLGVDVSYSTMAIASVAKVTIIAGVVPIVTENVGGVVTITVAPSVMVASTAISSSTEASTVSLAAPTFTHAWGPGVGCADMNAYDSEALDCSMDREKAVETCRDHCAPE